MGDDEQELVRKIETAIYDSPKHPLGVGYNEGLKTAIVIINEYFDGSKEAYE